MIGAVTTAPGNAGVNNSRMTVGREDKNTQIIILLSTDQLVSRELLAEVELLHNVTRAQVLDLSITRWDLYNSCGTGSSCNRPCMSGGTP